jgi:hypoxanthine-guanine phosphoribosyltransferase
MVSCAMKYSMISLLDLEKQLRDEAAIEVAKMSQYNSDEDDEGIQKKRKKISNEEKSRQRFVAI